MHEGRCIQCWVPVSREPQPIGQDDNYNEMVLARYECPKCGKQESILERVD